MNKTQVVTLRVPAELKLRLAIRYHRFLGTSQSLYMLEVPQDLIGIIFKCKLLIINRSEAKPVTYNYV